MDIYEKILERNGVTRKYKKYFDNNQLMDENIPEKSFDVKNKDLIGTDIIEGVDKKIADHIKENNKNLVFILGNNIVLTNKKNVRTVMKDARVYACKNTDGYENPENVIMKPVYFKLGNLGLMVNYAYIDLTHMNEIFNMEKQVYEFKRTAERLVTVVNSELIDNPRNPDNTLVSSSHCQEDQGGYVYEVKHVPTFEIMNKTFHKINIPRMKKEVLSELAKPKSKRATKKTHSLISSNKTLRSKTPRTSLAKTSRRKSVKWNSI
jgi:hypothetical protein